MSVVLIFINHSFEENVIKKMDSIYFGILFDFNKIKLTFVN